MKFALISRPEGHLPAVVDGDELVLLTEYFQDLNAIVEGGKEALEAVSSILAKPTAPRLPAESASFLAPISRFRRDVLCTGWNYWDHFEEGREMRAPQERPRHRPSSRKAPTRYALQTIRSRSIRGYHRRGTTRPKSPSSSGQLDGPYPEPAHLIMSLATCWPTTSPNETCSGAMAANG